MRGKLINRPCIEGLEAFGTLFKFNLSQINHNNTQNLCRKWKKSLQKRGLWGTQRRMSLHALWQNLYGQRRHIKDIFLKIQVNSFKPLK